MKPRKTSFLLTFSEIEGGNRFGVDYYNASEKDRVFVEAVARKNYGLKQASANGKAASTVEPFFGIHRAV